MKIKEKFSTCSSRTFFLVLMILGVMLVLSVCAAITFGNADLSWNQVYGVIGYELFHVKSLIQYGSGAVHDVVWLIRFPRVLLAVSIGMGLSVCGTVMQASVKNPLADPYILGVSSGASMGASLAILFGIGHMFGSGFVGIMAFLGAMGASVAVLLIDGGRGSNATRLILAGMAITAVCSSFSNFAIYLSNNKNAAAEVMFWMMGSLAGAQWSRVLLVLLVMSGGTLIFWTQFRNLNMMLLGSETSITLGTNLYKVRYQYMILVSFMVGISVYAAGTIGFIGFMIPHALRMIFGTDHKRLIPLCGLCGSVFLVWADVLCRSILRHSEIPVGILVSMAGAPSFIYLMMKHSYGFGGEDS